jgi:hypothetical protein
LIHEALRCLAAEAGCSFDPAWREEDVLAKVMKVLTEEHRAREEAWEA